MFPPRLPLFLLSIFCFLLCSCASPPPAPVVPWISLFTGRDLAGWRAEGKGAWSVEDGAIRMEQGPDHAWGWLWTERNDFRDFELELEWKSPDTKANSGIFFRCDSPDPAHRRDVRRALQADIGWSHHDPGWGGGFKGENVTGWLESGPLRMYMVINRAAAHAARPVGEWNRYRVVADGPRVILELNGRRTVDWTDDTPAPLVHPNAIGLQDHGGKGEAGMVVWFRNLRLRPLR